MSSNQSFNVDDIRRIREEADARYQSMTSEEISQDIHERAQLGYELLKKLQSINADKKGA